MDITLRRWRTSDAAALAEILSESDIHRTIADLPQPYTEKTALDYITFCINADVNNFWSFAIECDGELAGCISAERGKNVYRQSAEIGYYIAKPLWGRGIATAAVKNITQFIFENTDIIRLYSAVFAENIASIKVLEKCGFNFEGTLKSAAIKCGKICDLKLYAKIK